MPSSSPTPPQEVIPLPANVGEALRSLDHSPDVRPGVVVLRRRAGMLISLGYIERDFKIHPVALWASHGRVAILDPRGERQPERGPSEGREISGAEAKVLDTLAELGRNYLLRLEEIDTALASLEQDALAAPLADILHLKRQVAVIRSEVGRALSAMAEIEGPHLGASLPGLAGFLSPVREEILRLRELTSGTQTALTDILLLKQADQSNRLAAMANQLGQVSNRIAELANISNIRMLGLSYVMLILAVVSTVILFPNTAATILGMPSAAGVPGPVVVAALVMTALVPLTWFLSQRWIRDLFRGMGRYEAKVEEGMQGLKEHMVSPEDGRLPDEGSGQSSSYRIS